MRRLHLRGAFVFVIALVAAAITRGQGAPPDVFLFSCFTGNGEDGLHFARSDEELVGHGWQAAARSSRRQWEQS